MSKALEAKHDKILKGLLRQPDNKRCINCETLGPQYAVADLQVFVCTVCSGVHRQFSHRVKGLSTSTFKPEEIKALEAGGNRVAAYTYLAKWSPSELAKPLDRNTSKIKDWIDVVYVKKRFYSAEAASSAMHLAPVPQPQVQLPRRSISSNASSAGDEVPVMSVAGYLGDVKLKVDPNHFVSNAPNGINHRATSTASSHSHDSPAPSHVSHQLFNILDEPLAETAAKPLQETPPSAGWDAFAAPAAASVPTQPSATSWSAFDNVTLAVAAPHVTSHHQLPQQQQQQQAQSQRPLQQQSQQPSQLPQQQQQAPASMDEAWAVFGDSGSQAQQAQQQPQAQPQGILVQQQQPQQQQQEQAPAPVAAQPPKPAHRQELPLDLFGGGLLSSYSAAPASKAGMYGQQRGQSVGYQQPQPQPQPQPGFQYGQPTGYGQPPSGYPQAPSGYPQAQPVRSPGLPHGTSFSGYGMPPSGPPPSTGLPFDGPVRQRSHSDNSGSGDVYSAPDPFSNLGGLAGTLPSKPVSRQASGSSVHSGSDTTARPAWSPTPPVSQPFGQQAQSGSNASQGGNISFHDPFSGASYAAPPQHQAPGPSRPPPKSSGNPFA